MQRPGQIGKPIEIKKKKERKMATNFAILKKKRKPDRQRGREKGLKCSVKSHGKTCKNFPGGPMAKREYQGTKGMAPDEGLEWRGRIKGGLYGVFSRLLRKRKKKKAAIKIERGQGKDWENRTSKSIRRDQ